MSEATKDITGFTAAMATAMTTLKTFSQSASSISSSLSSMFKGIGSSASTAMTNVGNLTSSMFGTVNEKGWAQDLLMFPTRYMRANISQNRDLAAYTSAGLAPQAFASGASTQKMMAALAGQFGGVLGGSPQDLVSMMQIASQVGAGVDWRYYGTTVGGQVSPYGNFSGPRAPGFLKSMYQAQVMNPGVDLGTLGKSIGGQLANVSGAQQASFLTGGAFSMIGPGNQAKSISDWSDGILKWLQNLRPGSQRGVPFSYGELMSQNFPGSNIDAWLTAAGVNDDMKQYFWSYALAQAGTGHSSTDDLFSKNAAVNTSVAYNRLQASSAATQTGFQLAGQMAGAYANKEQANKWFAQLQGYMLNQILPQAMSTGPLSYMQYLPDTIEEMIMQLAERTSLGSLGAGVVGWGSALGSGILGTGGSSTQDGGDLGDVGDYGPMGGTTTAGLHPDMRKRVSAMMRANPNLRITSGYRDLATQQRLKRKGVGRVSGRPSDHTRGFAADIGPRSQYGWMRRNAGRFGLKTGSSQGEPWHVGMGDIGDDVGNITDTLQQYASTVATYGQSLGSTFGGLISSLFGGVFGTNTPEQEISGIGSGVSGILKLLMGAFSTPGGVNTNNLAYRDVYSQLVAATNGANKGLPPTVSGGGGIWDSFINNIRSIGASGGTAGVTAGGGGGVSAPGDMTLNTFFSQVLGGLGVPVTANNLSKLGAVARQEGNKGGSWNPFNSVGGDFPAFNIINGKPGVKNYPDSATGVAYTVQLLQGSRTRDMLANLRGDGSFRDWISATNAFYGSWGGGSININQAQGSQELTHVVGAGDIGDLGLPTGGGGTPMVLQFNNSFVIQGGAGGGNSAPNSGIDVRRTVTLIADQLEQEMQKRVARSN